MKDILLPPRMAYWLVPDEPWVTLFGEMIERLAGELNGPRFIPHVTLYCGAYDLEDEPERILEELSAFSAITLRTRQLEFGSKYTQSCYLRFEDHEIFSCMCRLVQSQVKQQQPLRLMPHLSICYGVVPECMRAQIQRELKFPDSVNFSLAMAITNPKENAHREDIESWKEWARCKLA